MPIHDWTRVGAGAFHDFHQGWTIRIRDILNSGLLPGGFYAMAEQYAKGLIPDVLTLEAQPGTERRTDVRGGVALEEAPPRARFMTSAEVDAYVAKANSIVIRHEFGQVVAVIEIVSPGNKRSQYGLRVFVEKSYTLLQNGINLLVVDLFPPTPRDPQGLHKAIWDNFVEEPFELPSDKPLTIAASMAGEIKRAYVEPIAVGDVLPSLPIFLDEYTYVPAPLEESYMAAWAVCPEPVRRKIESSAQNVGLR
jgi:hypothetical protein